ncbi:MAG TPA: adenylate/guanylate cyclase domain-containing protein [Burkholderiaceae bacterium]|nr:adenylate/guanylate cyclase domain-containing protein [Burkholderiaceae bacterium]
MPLERLANRAVLFADITGSSRLFVEAGDDRAREVVAATLQSWSELTTAHGGAVVQLRGDGMLCTFPSVDAALTAAVALRDLPYQPPLSMHAGIHAGPIQQEADQLYGDVVNIAARMADIAKRFEIVLTQSAGEQLTEPGRWDLRLIKHVPVKGQARPVNICLLPYDEGYSTIYRPPDRTRTLSTRLELSHGPRVVVVDAGTASCLIGRDADCTMQIDHQLVSRRHASVERVSGKFFLHDHSTNGTYVDDGSSAPVLVQREVVQLKGAGVISLGVEPQHNPDHLIRYAIGAA